MPVLTTVNAAAVVRLVRHTYILQHASKRQLQLAFGFEHMESYQGLVAARAGTTRDFISKLRCQCRVQPFALLRFVEESVYFLRGPSVACNQSDGGLIASPDRYHYFLLYGRKAACSRGLIFIQHGEAANPPDLPRRAASRSTTSSIQARSRSKSARSARIAMVVLTHLSAFLTIGSRFGTI
eukprot:6196907-Pleurochrysis_carterae.AAC.4